jgi:hypothetical protein
VTSRRETDIIRVIAAFLERITSQPYDAIFMIFGCYRGGL